MKKTIKINFVDWWAEFNKTDNYIYNLLKKYYEIEISENPDYLFYSCFGVEFLRYNCIRIFVTGENVRPDFNLCDYAMGFDFLQFGDRYIRFPYLFYYYNRNSYYKELFDRKISEEDFLMKKKFCNFIYSNPKTETPRDEIFHTLMAYKHVDSGGRYLNNIGEVVKDKLNFQRQYRFSIAVENSSTIGYNTEKIVQAFAAYTIPIYLGDPAISKFYNTKAFINGHDYERIEDIVLKIKEMEENPIQIYEMMSEPIFTSEQEYKILDIDAALQFLQNIFEQDIDKARRRSNYRWTIEIEKRYAQSTNDNDGKNLGKEELGTKIRKIFLSRIKNILTKYYLGQRIIKWHRSRRNKEL